MNTCSHVKIDQKHFSYGLNKYVFDYYLFFSYHMMIVIRGEMTFFHEIGHSMNANHDDGAEFKDRQKECNPSNKQGGSYLMYPTGTEGYLPNNRVYSACSLDTISYVLKFRKYFHRSN